MGIVNTVVILSFIPFGWGALFYLCFYKNIPKGDKCTPLTILITGLLTLGLVLPCILTPNKKVLEALFVVGCFTGFFNYLGGLDWATGIKDDE